MPNTEAPIFIIGVHGSGTTLLRYMLNSHPRIYIPPESDFIPRFFMRHPHRVLSDKRIAAILHIIFTRYRFVKEWQGPPPTPKKIISEMSAPTPAALLSALYSAYAHQHKAVRWGDKTPIYTSYVDLLKKLFSSAQVVHIIRDGRDVALSMLDKWGAKEPHIDLYFTARNWVRRVRQAQASSTRLSPEQLYELRYESLVKSPEQELQGVCAFLGEQYVSEMAQPHILGAARIPPGDFHEAIREPPNTSRVQRWQREMSEKDQRLFQWVAGDLLTGLGYPVWDLGKMSLTEKTRFTAYMIKYEVMQGGRRTLQRAGLMPPI